ncbi:uncharacterized protein METZ01_LOCUS93600 [marine metagenome]|uniref:Uncharacterized protein n=1 Tax=marine metagenome TaxID=408172 RepID=A0A381VK91_9ZZZZ
MNIPVNNFINNVINEFVNGNKEKALKKLHKHIKKNDGDVLAKYNYAYMHHQLGNIKTAIQYYTEVAKLSNNQWKSRQNLALIYLDTKQYSKALKFINEVLLIKENYQPALRDKALILFQLNQLDEALITIKESIKLNNKDYIAYNTMGLILLRMLKKDEAKKIFIYAIQINKDYVPSFSNLGRCYEMLNMPEESLKCFEQAMEIDPNSFIVINNLAGYYLDKGLYEKGLQLYLKANSIDSSDLTVLSNIAASYFYLDNFELSIKYIRQCLKKDPQNDKFKKLYCLILFKIGEYEKAWPYHEGRLQLSTYFYSDDSYKIKKFLTPDKELLPENKILIIKEQGIGDEILFSSMYPELLNNFKNVTIESDQKLIPIFKKSMPISKKNIFYPLGEFSSSEKKLKKFDRVLYAGSLGKTFRLKKSDFPSAPYLKTEDAIVKKIEKELSDIDNNYKIGISWKSFRKKKSIGLIKSMELNDFQSLINLPKLTFINLQYGDIKKEILEFNNNNHRIHTIESVDMYDDLIALAALLTNLNLFIATSNTTAHLAGALGVETWLIKPKNHASFPYWNQVSDQTPWYGSVKLYDGNKNTKEIVGDIKNDLLKKFNLEE